MAHVIMPLLALALMGTGETPVSGGSPLDYQASVIQPWQASASRIVVFERLNAQLSGDLWTTRSDDHGATWSTPMLAIGGAANERHAALVQTATASYQLFHLSNAGGAGFRIHRASSSDGNVFTAHGSIDLGWDTGGEINPHVVRVADGTLFMTYHRLNGAAYIARSDDGGVTWDHDRIQVSEGNAALPRLTWRASDGTFLLVYQTNPGDNQLRLWARTTKDATTWTNSAEQIVSDGNNHDALPLALDDQRFVVFWSRVADGHFQVFSMLSVDEPTFGGRIQHTRRPGLANVQPHVLDLGDGLVDLYWGAAQDAAGTNYDIVRRVLDLHTIFGNGLEKP